MRKTLAMLLLPAVLIAGSTYVIIPDSLTISSAFPGGNIIVDSAKGDSIFIRPDQHETSVNWFHWYFSVNSLCGRTLYFKFPSSYMARNGAALSLDSGKTWDYEKYGTNWIYDQVITYAFTGSGEEVRFAMDIPYVQSDWEMFTAQHFQSPFLSLETLTVTDEGRAVEKVRLGRLDGSCDYRVLLTARHHANEAPASQVLEGLIEYVLTDTTELAVWFREHVEFFVVPFVDKDGVENGEQGKGRIPHDHNRDYSSTPLYEEVAAIMDQVPAWSEGKIRFAMDIHSPGLSSPPIGFYTNEENGTAFCMLFDSLDVLPDTIYNPLTWGNNFSHPIATTCAWWAQTLDGIIAAVCMEIPFDMLNKTLPATRENLKAVGPRVLKALRLYLLNDNATALGRGVLQSAPTQGVISAAPNPFNPSTTVRFELPAGTTAMPVIINSQGRIVRNFPAVEKSGSLFWDGRDSGNKYLASGIYLARFTSKSGIRLEQRLILLR